MFPPSSPTDHTFAPSRRSRLRAGLELARDLLTLEDDYDVEWDMGDQDPDSLDSAREMHTHPHRRPLREPSREERRPGSPVSPPLACLCPIGGAPATQRLPGPRRHRERGVTA